MALGDDYLLGQENEFKGAECLIVSRGDRE